MQPVIIFIALLALPPWLLSGCGTPLRTGSETSASPDRSAQNTQTKAPDAAAVPPQPQLAQKQPAQEEKAATAPPAPAEAKNDEVKTATAPAEKKEPAQAPEEPPATVLQEVVGPKADDRLLGLLQKEIDQAMRQPAGRRKIQFSMPLIENDRVRFYIDFFCGKMKGFFERALARSGKYIPMMATVLQEAGLPEDLVYLSLIESGFAPSAYSKAKAVGPWQFIRATGVRYGLRIDNWVDERRDPVKSTRAAAAYLKDLHQQFGEWFLAAAAYNAGERRVETAIQRTNANDFWELSQRTILKQETRNYVPKFIAAALIAGAPEKYGFSELVYEAPVDYDEVTTHRPLTFQTIANLARTTVTNLKELNPALLRNVTPPSEQGFSLRVPSGSGEIFNQAYKAKFDSTNVKMTLYTVKKGETLAAIAKRYHARVSQIIEANDLKTTQLRVGQQLTIIQDGSGPETNTPKAAPKTPPSPSKKTKSK
ncbi:MAG TPA: transglycosylase SLT domain-containing protein [Candidatus Binatia bacterium]